MGAWGTGNFENDTTLDWQDEFLESRPAPAKLATIFKRFLKSSEPDADAEQEFLSAAEALAGLRGHPLDDMPDALADWVSASRSKPKDEWVESATQGIERIINNSELKDLWDDSENADEWRDVQLDLLRRLQNPPRKKAKRPKGPKLRMQRDNGAQRIFTYLGADSLPDLGAPDWQITWVEINLSEPLVVDDLPAIAKWLATHPTVTIALDDYTFGSIKPEQAARWPEIEQKLPLFSHAQKLDLNLSQLTHIDFLAGFSNLQALGMNLVQNVDLRVLKNLSALKQLRIQDGQALVPDDASKYKQIRVDLAQLEGTSVTHLDVRYVRLKKPSRHLHHLAQCESLLFDFFYAGGTFKLPSLAEFTQLTRLHFLSISAQCLKNALEAPALAELYVFIDRATLDKCRDLLKNKKSLTHLTVMLQETDFDPFDQDPATSNELGLELCDPDQWDVNP